MRIQPPEVEVPDAEPFKNALFGRKTFGLELTSLLRNIDDSIVLFVNAPWGEGKTTFARMWRAHLTAEKLDVIYYDAYASDYFEDPFVSFSGEILSLVKRKLAEVEGITEQQIAFKKTAIEVGKKLAGVATKIALKAATMGAVDASNVAELKEIGSELASGVSEAGEKIVEKRIEEHLAEKDVLKSFRENLSKLAKVFREQQGFPLTIIVDELDRCRPSFALGLLERIKHLFDVPNVAFVLLVNRDQIESYVRTVYGQDVDARAYLLKFGNLFVDLPLQAPETHHEHGKKEFVRAALAHYGLEPRNDRLESVARSLEFLVDHFDLTLRDTERVLLVLSIYLASVPANHFTVPFLAVLLAILKLKRPELYEQLRRQEVKLGDFLDATGLKSRPQVSGDSISPNWVVELLTCCLATEAELEESEKSEDASAKKTAQRSNRFDGWFSGYNIGRLRVIPYLCARLDRFTTAPAVKQAT